MRRTRARLALDAMQKLRQEFNYDAGKNSRRLGDWTPTSADANTAIGGNIVLSRARARDLVRNDAYAKRTLNELVGSLVGTGIIPRPSNQDERLNKQISTEFKNWSEECDADGDHDFWGLQKLIARSLFESGEVLVRFRPRRATDGVRIPLQLQVLEADFIDSNRTQMEPDGGYTVQGVQFDKIGRRVGYWLFGNHPGAPLHFGKYSNSSHFVPALTREGFPNLIHVFLKDRPGQVRGFTWFGPVTSDFADLSSYEEAKWMRARMEACIGLIVTSPEGTASLLGQTSPQSDGTIEEEMRAGMIFKGRPGQEVDTLDPKPSGDYDSYTTRKLQRIAAGMGPMYEQISGDFGNVTFSSFRGGQLSYWNNVVEPLRWLMFIPSVLRPVYRRMVDAAWLAGHIEKPGYGVEWAGSRMPSVEPLKDIEAQKARIRSGLQTYEDTVSEGGYYADEVLPKIAEFQKKAKDMGVVLDTDPSQTAGNGGPANPQGAKDGKPATA
jgi:lambda family phage portal protein